jgi:hypothetical protein
VYSSRALGESLRDFLAICWINAERIKNPERVHELVMHEKDPSHHLPHP